MIFIEREGNILSEALSIHRGHILDAGTMPGIGFVVVGLFSGVTKQNIDFECD